MKNKELKVMYFERGAAALRNVKPVIRECYCCPLCARLYPRDAIDLGLLTLEHAPPRRVGGKPIALTCKKCNSVSGYSVDCAIVERERLRDFARAFTEEKQDYKGRATLQLGRETLNVDIVQDQGTLSIKPVEKINDPKKIRAYQDYMKELSRDEKWDGQTFTITSTARYSVKRSRVGDLKAAFIICFAFFGYTYTLNHRLSSVREQIADFSREIIDYYWLGSDPKVSQDRFICLTQEPVPALAVKLNNSSIILPWLEGPKDLYEYIRVHHVGNGPITFKGRYFNWPQTLEMKLDFLSDRVRPADEPSVEPPE